MNLIGRLPTRQPRPARKHRAADEVDRLQFLLAAANTHIKGLHRQHADTVQRIDQRHAETVLGLEQQIADLQRRLQVGVLAEHVVAETQELDVRTVVALWDARDAGLLGPVTDPGRIRT